jgi:hypothetical protein
VSIHPELQAGGQKFDLRDKRAISQANCVGAPPLPQNPSPLFLPVNAWTWLCSISWASWVCFGNKRTLFFVVAKYTLNLAQKTHNNLV